MSNYYLALGVDKDADFDKIRKAYRVYCKKYHPDLASPREKEQFLKIQEAYDTLSDDEKRKLYDSELAGTSRSVPVSGVSPVVWERKRKQDEHIQRFSSLIDEIFDSFVSGLYEEEFSGHKELYMELILSPLEAAQGGTLPVDIPVKSRCPVCGGHGTVAGFLCSSCRGSGRIRENKCLDLHVPPGITSGTSARVDLAGIGLPELFLNVDVIVR